MSENVRKCPNGENRLNLTFPTPRGRAPPAGDNAGERKELEMGRHYTRQFRQQAMKLVTDQGYTVGRAACELGIPDKTLDRWLKKTGWTREPIVQVPSSEDPRVLSIQVRELQKQVKRLEMEKEILKKATAYFASPHLRDSGS